MQYYNIHTHVFTMNNAPKKFLHLYLPAWMADAVDRITDLQPGSWIIQKLLETFGGNGGKRYASFLRIGKSKSQLEVFRQLRDQYKDRTFKFIGLTMFMEECGAGGSASGYEGQLEEVIAIKRQFPDNLYIFLGVDPRWKQSGQELHDTVVSYFEKKIELADNKTIYPFIGLKLYPCMGFYPFDERLKETLTWAAENEVPVLSHCNYLGGIYNNDRGYIDTTISTKDPYNNNQIYPPNPITYQDKKSLWDWLKGRQESGNNLNLCSYYMEPNAYR